MGILISPHKGVLRSNYIYKFITLLPNDYCLIPDNGAKNLFRPFLMYIKDGIVLSFENELFRICNLNHCKYTGRTSNKSGYLKSRYRSHEDR